MKRIPKWKSRTLRQKILDQMRLESGGPQPRDEAAYNKRRSYHAVEHGGTRKEEE